jgi:predicted phosphodiesterase
MGFSRSTGSRDRTDPFEQIGHSTVKRLWRQKREFTLNPPYALANMAPVATAILSDLHLGTRSQADVLRRPALRRILFEAIADADEILLLGDVIELREQPLRAVLDIALPFFDELGQALPGRRVTIVAGNHDHRLVEGWLQERRLAGEPLGLEERTGPASSQILTLIAERMPRTELELAYPGVWLRPRTYATHGHYVDCHMSVPRLEAIAASAVARATGGMPAGRRTPDDYEAVLTPLYAFAYALAQGSARARRALGMDLSRRVWDRIDRRRDLRSRALASLAIPSAVWGLNRAGLGPFDGKLSGATLRDSGLRAMSDLVDALGIDADEVIFGHTHRPGPLDRDGDWDKRLFNAGSWLYEPSLLSTTAIDSPYWPGVCLWVDGDKPPELRRLLEGVTQADLGLGEAYS